MTSMNLRLAALTLCAVLATTALAADKENPFSARAGLFWPMSSHTRSETKTLGFGLGVSYQLPNLNMGAYNNANWGLDLDGMWVGSGGNKIEAYDLMLVGRWMNTNLHAGQMSFYYGAGVGLSRMRGESTTTTTSGGGGGGDGGELVSSREPVVTTTTNSESKTSLAGKILIGTMLSKQAFAELAFRIAPSVNGINTNGLSLQIGYKF